MPLDCVTHCYLILRPLTSSQRGFISLVHPAYSPIALRSRWLRPANHGFTLQSELFKQVLCEAALSSSPKLGHAVQMLHSHVPVEQGTARRSKRQSAGFTQEEWRCGFVWVNHTQLQSTCLTATLASTFALLTQIKLLAGIDLSGTLARVHVWINVRLKCSMLKKAVMAKTAVERIPYQLLPLWSFLMLTFSKNETWQNGSGANVIPSSEKHCFNFVHSLWAKKMRWTASLCSSSEYAMKTKSMD